MKNVTMVAIEFQWYELTRYAIERSLNQCDAGDVLIITDKPNEIAIPGARYITRDPVANFREYNQIMLKEVGEHVNTSHALYVQWDGIANNRSAWTSDFLNYDYIGAPWPWEPEGRNVGNGGFSLRSKKLLDACLDDKVQLTEARGFVGEDSNIAVDFRPFLESKYDIKFAPTELAKQFSFEHGTYDNSFGFHGLWNVFNLMSDADMDYFASLINYKGWNMYKWHHTLAAVIYRGRMDIFAKMLSELENNNPELLDLMSRWLENDAQNSHSGIVVN